MATWLGTNNLSSNTIKKAEKLVENGGVVKIEDDLFQVKSSSDPSKSYFVTSDSCECPGFKNSLLGPSIAFERCFDIVVS